MALTKYLQSAYNVLESLREFTVISIIIRILLALILSSIMGLERSKNGRAAGLRTHILVCLGACLAAMTGCFLSKIYGTGDPSRIAAQVISGIGFLGAGTILTHHHLTIVGLTTAAGIWVTGVIGITIGYGFYEAAIVTSLLVFLVMDKFSHIEKRFKPNTYELRAYVEFIDATKINSTLVDLYEKNITFYEVSFAKVKTNLPSGLAANMSIIVSSQYHTREVMEIINSHENVSFAAITNQ